MSDHLQTEGKALALMWKRNDCTKRFASGIRTLEST